VASKRRLRRRACDGKRRYPSADAARAQLPALYRRLRLRAAAGGAPGVAEHFFGVYRCEHCGQHHIGHLRKRPQWAVKRDAAG
jgi:hypothetical protein